MGAERRKNLRVSLDVEVDIETQTNFSPGGPRDVSEGGLFIQAPVVPEPGTELSLKLSLGRRVFNLNCRVAWVLQEQGGASVGFGAEFVSLPPGGKRAIESFVQKRDPEVFDLLDDVECLDDAEDEITQTRPAAAAPPPLPRAVGAGAPPPLPK